jgi:hypothetical protein
MNPRRWIYVLGGLVVVLAIALVIALVARDDNSSGSASSTSTSESTTLAPTITVAPTTTKPPTSTTAALPVITNDPQSYAKFLFAAWQNGDQQAATMVASSDAVSQMFSQAYQPSNPYTFGSCDPAAGSVYCTWTSASGPKITMTVRNITGGLPILVVGVMRS